MSAQRRHESPDLGGAALRMMRALVRRAAEGDTEALEQLQRLEEAASVQLGVAALRAHREAGYSWTEIARVLGISRQAARQRFAPREEAPE